MIRLHTGVPGTGKTSLIVDTIEHDKTYDGRTVYSHAVDGWERAVKVRCLHPACRVCRMLSDDEKKKQLTIETWFEWVCPGDLLVIDEAHYPFPSRREKEQPLFIQRLTEHRHDGVDIWLATPNCNFLDINVRRLVQQHKHFCIRPTGRFTYTHTECMESDDKLRFGIEERFFLPKRSFTLYKSADAHVKLKSSLPLKFYGVVALPLVAVGAMWWTWGNLKSFMKDEPEPVVVEQIEAVRSVGSFMESPEQRNSVGLRTVAPVVELPAVLGCIVMANDCRCYDVDAERVVVPVVQCKNNAEGSLPTRELTRL